MEKGYYFMGAETIPRCGRRVAIHNKNGKGLLQELGYDYNLSRIMKSQSTIKMEKGYYEEAMLMYPDLGDVVAIHNKNGKGLLLKSGMLKHFMLMVAIHNKNGKGLLLHPYGQRFQLPRVAIHNKNGKGLLL